MPPHWTGSASRPMTASLIAGDDHRQHAAWPTRPKGEADPYAGFEARIVPENITLLPKSADAERTARTPGTSARSW